MNFVVDAAGLFALGERQVRCALGRSGVVAARQKREGDGASPAGTWALRRLLYRPDQGEPPQTRLSAAPIARDDAWCDDPDDPAYNRPVKLPFRGSFEKMWRDDHLYDLVVVLGHNDAPVKPFMGSAIFLHLAKDDYAPTEGCVALSRPDLEAFLALAQPGDTLEIRP